MAACRQRGGNRLGSSRPAKLQSAKFCFAKHVAVGSTSEPRPGTFRGRINEKQKNELVQTHRRLRRKHLRRQWQSLALKYLDDGHRSAAIGRRKSVLTQGLYLAPMIGQPTIRVSETPNIVQWTPFRAKLTPTMASVIDDADAGLLLRHIQPDIVLHDDLLF